MMVPVELPENSLAILETSPEELARELRFAAVVKWYEMGKLSQSKASEIAGISREEFLGVLRRFRVSPFQSTRDELEEELSRSS